MAKRIAVYPRYSIQATRCRIGYQRYGDRYPYKTLFVAGLPKSGTTWLKKMIASYPGFDEVHIPDVAAYEMAMGRSHDYDMPADIFERFRDMLVITKMHVHGSLHNTALLKAAGVPYVIIYRDLRDVAVSHVFYVRNTPWHPEHSLYRGKTVQEGLEIVAAHTLPSFMNWIRLWRQNRDPELSMELRYEDLLAAPMVAFTRVARHFKLDSSPETIQRIVDTFSFKKMSHGRERGQENQQSFVRKGVSGDWVNHFDARLTRVYARYLDNFLEEVGYAATRA
ncbi:MAG: sulfotransferase domain-containing protein [Chloroflexaceae bacterium]|nr:sulfotransferase domain-containing protein [Chloroflexaceae bacterium]